MKIKTVFFITSMLFSANIFASDTVPLLTNDSKPAPCKSTDLPCHLNKMQINYSSTFTNQEYFVMVFDTTAATTVCQIADNLKINDVRVSVTGNYSVSC